MSHHINRNQRRLLTALLLAVSTGSFTSVAAQNQFDSHRSGSLAELPVGAIQQQETVDAVGMTVIPSPMPAPGAGVTPYESPQTAQPMPIVNPLTAGRNDQEAPEHNGIIVVDTDQFDPPPSTQKAPVWKELADSPDKSIMTRGTEFPVSSISSLTSKTAKVGDPIEARLKVDLKIGGKLIAPKGSLVRGHVTSAYPARRLLIAEIGLKRWMRANGAIGLQFDEIINHQNEHIPLEAIPAKRPKIINNKNTGRVLGVNHQGQIVSPLSTQLKHQGIHLAIRGAAATGGVFGMGAVPVVFGALGAADPSFAFMHPVGKNVHHRRLKGFGMGVLSGLPGGFILADFLIRGVESQISPGDEFLVSLKQDFTGKKSTSAELVPYPHTQLRGEIMLKPTKKSKRSSVD